MREYGSDSCPADDERLSVDEIELLEGWLDGNEPLTTKDAKRLLDKVINDLPPSGVPVIKHKSVVQG